MAQQVLAQEVLLGDEAVALGAVHAGITAAYAYPGTPATEILEYLLRYKDRHGKPHAAWCANEKTALEEALGTSFAGRRALVSMKHVGLNVAADPFINSAIVSIHGGVVLAVADDPGMHSSQNEQDTRYFVDFARVMCLEPANQQEAYHMTMEAFDLSERFDIPVVVRLVTRLAHSRAVVETGEGRPENPISKVPVPSSWILLPSNARRQWKALLDRQGDILAYTENCPHNVLTLTKKRGGLGVITTGIARNYYMEALEDLAEKPSHLHIGAYPLPVGKIRELVGHADRVIILEEGYPYLESKLRGIVPPSTPIHGKEDGRVPIDGELNPDIVRKALGLEVRDGVNIEGLRLPGRPPQLCQGCPHGDAYGAIKRALASFDKRMVTSDIGCYTLGALPPYSAIESCVCMGASVGMAKGAAEAGFYPVVAVIGDSTFLHSGVTPLMDAASANANMTLIILDNETVAMTGTQPTVLPSSRLQTLILGLGVDPDHFHIIDAHPKKADENTDLIRREIEHKGLSVIVAVRTCLEEARKKKKEGKVQG
jgi:indolepyruvate ferredoxin oxidoreductase alpha subunit